MRFASFASTCRWFFFPSYAVHHGDFNVDLLHSAEAHTFPPESLRITEHFKITLSPSVRCPKAVACSCCADRHQESTNKIRYTATVRPSTQACSRSTLLEMLTGSRSVALQQYSLRLFLAYIMLRFALHGGVLKVSRAQ